MIKLSVRFISTRRVWLKKFKGRNVLNKQFIEQKDTIKQESEFEIVRQKKFAMTPMSPEEAILQMNLLGHNFYMFLNAEIDNISVIYRRDDGKYGLIEATK